MFQKANVTIKFRDQVFGGLPKSRKVIQSYLEAKFGQPTDNFAERLAEEVHADLDEKQELVTTGFKVDTGGGLYLSDYQMKAMLKQCASLLGITKNVKGSKQIFHEGLVIKPERLYVGRMEPDGAEEFCGHVMTPMGKRSVLRQGEYVRQAELSFQVWVLDVNKVTMKHLETCFELGQEVGLGSYKSFEKGKFDVTQFEIVPG